TDGLACALEERLVPTSCDPVGVAGAGLGDGCDGATSVAGALSATGADFFSAAGAALLLSVEEPVLSSRSRIGEPSEILSPEFTSNFFTTPADGDGISIVALSLSR